MTSQVFDCSQRQPEGAPPASELPIVGYTIFGKSYCVECALDRFEAGVHEFLTSAAHRDITAIRSGETSPAGLDCSECNAEIIAAAWTDPAYYVVKLYNSEDDPTQILAIVEGEFANEWADHHGSLCGGTWEQADGPEFIYDILSWSPGLIEKLEAEGYRFDQSEYSDPDERDLAIAEHAYGCDECRGDWHRAERHLLPENP